MKPKLSQINNQVAIIGSGFAGLSAACYLAKSGMEVTVLEKNFEFGGRARIWEYDLEKPNNLNELSSSKTKIKKGKFIFDMGPSWYWMPDVFAKFFGDFDKLPADFYELIRLDPAYRIFRDDRNNFVDLPSTYQDIQDLFQQLEPDGNGAQKLDKFINFAEFTYNKAVHDYMLRPSHSPLEFASLDFVSGVVRAGILSSYGKQIHKQFEHPSLRQILEFPVLFLGATPGQTPYLYALMAYTQIIGGTWYPLGGLASVSQSMVELAQSLGVKFINQANVTKIRTKNDKAIGLEFAKNNESEFLLANWIVAGADYNHVEQNLLEPKHRRYSSKYWDKRTMSPSSLLFYIGVEGKLDKLLHHNLFFETDFELHASEIYNNPKWPSDPLFYVCCPSKTEAEVAPVGCENLFVLMPLAPGLEDTQAMRDKYYQIIVERMEKRIGQSFQDKIIVKRSYCLQDFQADYNSFKGNAYGLANTLGQTAIFKPKMKSKLPNLFYAGQLTVPGPGIPPSIISGQLAAGEVLKLHSANYK